MKRSASRVTRDLHRKRLLPADEAVAEHDLGTLRQHVLDQTVLPVHSHNVLLGLSHRHVFVYGGRRPSFAVPLADVVTVETFHSMVTVTYLDGEAVGHFHWQRAKPGDVERLAGLIRAGAERSASAAAAALRADVEESWRYQARRSRPASRQAERTMRNGVRESMSVRVLGVVSDPNDAPPPSLEPGRWPELPD